MLTELAITPQVFSDDANSGDSRWLEHIRQIGNRMRLDGPPVIISDLHDGQCLPALRKAIGSIRDGRVRPLAKSLYSKLYEAAVWRPSLADWPEDEQAWLREAMAAHRQSPIDRIVVTSDTFKESAEDCRPIRRLSHVQSDEFWQGVRSGKTVAMSIPAQIELLRPVWLHAGFISFISPCIYSKGSSEADFAIALARSMLARPWRRNDVVIDIHTEACSKDPCRVDNQLTWLRKRFEGLLGKGGRFRLFLWSKILDRWLVAGKVSLDGQRVILQPRWFVSMNHVARPDDPPDAMPTRWHLVPRDEVNHVCERYFERYDSLVLGPQDMDTIPAA